MAVEVRPVDPAEFEKAGRVTAEAYREFGWAVSPNADYLERVADIARRAPQALVLGAFEAGRVLGTVTLELDDRIPGGHPRPPLEPDQAHVRMLGVASDSRRRGLGRALMEAAIEWARSSGKRRMTLDTTETMVAAHRLYESMGFQRLPDLEWPDGFRLLAYELRL